MSTIDEDKARLSQLFGKLGYDVEADIENGLRVNTGGVHVTVVVYDDGTLSLVCSVAGGGVDLRLQDVNEANSRVRFAKFSVEGGNLLLEADFVFALHNADASAHLLHIMHLWDLAFLELRRLVTELASDLAA